MDKARYLVEAHVREGRAVSELAAAHGVHRSWIYKLLARYREGGLEAVRARSRRPRSCKHQTPPEIVEAIVSLRSELSSQGHDAGAETIAFHLAQRHKDVPSVRTIWRILKREGLVVSQPKKRPRSSWKRFCAELPNELWQTDVTCWSLACGREVEILNCLDDHSRLFLGADAYERVKAADVVDSFHKAAQLHNLPQALLSDNGAVFTGSYRGGKVLLEYELERLGVEFKNSRPYHPQTLGKVERLLDAQALSGQAAARQHAGRAAGPAGWLSPLLQPHPPAPGPRAAHALAGLQCPPEGQARRRRGSDLLPGA